MSSRLWAQAVRSRSGVRRLRSLLIYGAALLVVIETLAPVYWMIVTSVSDGKDLLNPLPQWIPEHPTLSRYQAIFSAGQVALWSGTTASPGAAFLRGVLNSLIVAGATTLVCLFFGLLTAYAMSRLRFRGKRVLCRGFENSVAQAGRRYSRLVGRRHAYRPGTGHFRQRSRLDVD